MQPTGLSVGENAKSFGAVAKLQCKTKKIIKNSEHWSITTLSVGATYSYLFRLIIKILKQAVTARYTDIKHVLINKSKWNLARAKSTGLNAAKNMNLFRPCHCDVKAALNRSNI